MTNPWMSLWLSTAHKATNTWSGAARGLWAGAMHRQHRAMLDEMSRQASEFWMGAARTLPVRAQGRHGRSSF